MESATSTATAAYPGFPNNGDGPSRESNDLSAEQEHPLKNCRFCGGDRVVCPCEKCTK
jgi:hypothetical protein